jgi:PAS domain S-box-containing protein
MKQPYNQQNDTADIREQIIGLGERSIRKSYYPELQEKLADLERFKTLLDQSSDAIFLTEIPSGRLIYGSKSACSQIGVSEEECTTLTMYDIIPDKTEALDRIFSGKTDSIIFDARLLKRSGEKTPYELNMHTVTFKDRKYVVTIARDITERKRAEEELRESEEKFRALAESSAAAIIVYQGKWLVSVNPAAERITGYTKDELLKMRLIDLIHPDFKEEVLKRALARQRGEPEPSQYETMIITNSGEARWVLLSVGLMLYRGKPAGVVTLLDITERKRAEEQLRNSEVHLAVAQKIAHLGSFEWDMVSGIDIWSDELYYILGLRPGEVKPSLEAYLNVVHSDDREIVNKSIANSRSGREIPGGYEIRIVRPDGTIRWVSLHGQFIYDGSGRPVRMIGTLMDITERKLAELDRERLLHEVSESKLQAELFLDLMGHDITNMNQALRGYLEMMELMQESGKIDKALIDNSIKMIDRSSRMISDVKKLTRLQAGKLPLKNMDLCQVLSRVKAQYSSVPGRSVTIHYTPCGHYIVRADDLLEDLFSNLVDNAIRHSTGPLIIEIGVNTVTVEGRHYYRIVVADTGPGIPDNMKGKIIMTPAERKEKMQRRGLGLFLVRTLVDYYHGRVWVEDRVPGDHTKGARFVVMLPEA